MFAIRDSQFYGFGSKKLQTLWRESAGCLHLLQMESIAFESLEPDYLTVCNFHLPLLVGVQMLPSWLAYLFAPYHLHYLDLFPRIDDSDSRKMDYRNDAKHQIPVEFCQTLFHKKNDEPQRSLFRLVFDHIHCSDSLSIPNIVFHCRKFLKSLCLLFPKIVQCLLRYTGDTYQTPVLVCQSPAAPAVRGTFVPIIAQGGI